MSQLQAGAKAPSFTLPTDGGGTVSLADLKGKKVVVYFYPKADTPGCTIEAKSFSAMKGEFDAANTAIVGVSADPIKAQDKFKAKYGLEITLASDETLKMLEDYGVWVEKSMYGKKYMGIERTTVLIDTDGTISRVWPKVKVEGHTEEVLQAAKSLV